MLRQFGVELIIASGYPLNYVQIGRSAARFAFQKIQPLGNCLGMPGAIDVTEKLIRKVIACWRF